MQKAIIWLAPPQVAERFAAGGAAGALGQFTVYPLEIVKTRMQTSAPGLYSSMLGCMRSIAGAEGWTAL
jgi:solute carrier family 25 phosphate transporter 23/24/25/41